MRDLLAPYLDAVAAFNPARTARSKIYPGSPALLRHWLRTQDRLIACEREPAAARALAGRMRGDNRVKAVAIDGYTALNAYVPPKERRGLVLIDPPFEQPDEFDAARAGARRRPPQMADRHLRALVSDQGRARDAGLRAPPRPARTSRACCAPNSTVAPARGRAKARRQRPDRGQPALDGWRTSLRVLLPALAQVLRPGAGGAARLDWLAGESDAVRRSASFQRAPVDVYSEVLALTFRLHRGAGGNDCGGADVFPVA